MSRRIVVILNAGAGGGNDEATLQALHEHFAAAGSLPALHQAHGGDELRALIAQALAERPDVIVAGGGDGTVSSVAGALVDTDIALGVLPLGTLNHFAKDLGVPQALEDAVRQIVTGTIRRVDVGEVNGRIFINNSSLGLYPEIVRRREQQQRRLGRSKWTALLWASLAVLRRYPFLGVRLRVDGEERLRRTPFVFIGNNEYRMEGFGIGERAGLTDGHLSLYVTQRVGRLRLLQLALRALFGRLRQARDFDAIRASEILIDSKRPLVRVSADGEVVFMSPPLRYRIRPASLAVVAPAPPSSDA